MTESVRTIPLATARRLAIVNQHLAGGAHRKRTPNDVLSVLRDLVYVQLDTFHTVIPPQVIAIWSRVDDLRPSEIDRLLWKEKQLFETAPEPVSLSLAEDYPLHYSLMKRKDEPTDCWWGRKRDATRRWLTEHKELSEGLLGQLEGAELTLQEFEGHVPGGKREDGWTSGSDVALTLLHLQSVGEVMVVGRRGHEKVWGRPSDFLPAWFERKELASDALERCCAERALHALGAATASEMNYYFPRGKYYDLRGALSSLEKDGKVHRVRVEGLTGGGARFVHDRDVPLLDALGPRGWAPRMALLSPYDNLIAGRDRTQRLFSFDYTHGNYLPPVKRKYGVYVLPILWGDRIIGRLDPRWDRERRTLRIDSVHAEPHAPVERDVAREVARSVERMAKFVGVKDIEYGQSVPGPWRAELR